MLRIVVPFYRNYETIENLLLSIQDQDYKKHETIIVVDGSDKQAEKLLVELQEKYSFIFAVIEQNSGAPTARNYGAQIKNENSSYEFLFFIDADCRLYAGIFRECITQFELNPGVDFIYGNYRFNNRQEFYSQPFDPYLLETMNYICTMSPMRRSCFERVNGFRDKQEYFQDWDLFYRISKSGSVGLYINEFMFETKLPLETDISGRNGITIPAKAENFRKLNGIHDKKIVVTTHAAPYQAIQRAKMLDADYVGPAVSGRRQVFPTNYCFDWDATYFVGCFNDPLEALTNHIKVTIGKPIYHFIGTDVFQMITTHSVFELKQIKKAFEINNAKLFANSPRLVAELLDCGISAELLYTPVFNISQYTAARLPDEFTIGVYYSDSNQMHHRSGAGGLSNIPLIDDVAKSLPGIKFKFFGGAAKGVAGNIEMCGRIPEHEMVEFIGSCSMIIRSTIHDGFPQLPIQFLMSGRKALVSCPDEMIYADKLSFETITNYAEHKEEIINKIYSMQLEEYDDISLSIDAKREYSKLMSESKFVDKINSVINEKQQ